MDKNKPELWDRLWDKKSSLQEDQINLAKEELNIRWQRIEKIVQDHFKSFKGLNVIEIGAGLGTNAALMSQKGAQVTVLDYSEKALARSNEFFLLNKLKAETINADALNLPKSLLNKYDIVMSFGLSEHFSGEDRFLINKVHFDLAKKNGLVFIAVPNKMNPFYMLFKTFFQNTSLWRVGKEYPFTRGELSNLCKKMEIKSFWFIGDSFFWSFNFINPLKLIRRLFKIQDPLKVPARPQKGTCIDQYFSYSLVLCAKK